jgi:hypothetical protein
VAKPSPKSPSPERLAHDALYAKRLVEAVTLLVGEHAAEHHLTQAVVLGSLSWVLGRMIGAIARDGGTDLDRLGDFIVGQLRQAAVGEMARRPYTLH